ncbi:MAG: 30S ribosomal protein S11 [Patescibacteria group bacterium]
MGKKTIKTEDTAEALKAQEKVEAKIKKAGPVSASKKLESSRIYISSSYNNTLITITDSKGGVIAWSSAGSLGFKGPRKATAYAATSTVNTLLQKVKKFDLGKVSIYVRGIGGGREAAIRALINNNQDIQLIKDVTPVPHNGPRPKKTRRV